MASSENQSNQKIQRGIKADVGVEKHIHQKPCACAHQCALLTAAQQGIGGYNNQGGIREYPLDGKVGEERGLQNKIQYHNQSGDDDSHSCPYFYLWDMQGLGKLSAYTTISLINGDITGAKDDKFTAGDLGDYTVTEADDGGTEVVLGAPLKFDTSNIEEMAKLY